MASYVIHDIAGEVLLKNLSEKLNIQLSEENRNHFLMGNLIPDSSRLHFESVPDNLSRDELKKIKKSRTQLVQQEKQSTHFRPTSDIDKNIQTPEIDVFLDKYRHLLSSDISTLGYLFHLYTDKMFFGQLFERNFIFLDENKKHTSLLSATKTIILKSDNQEYEADSIFSQDSETSIYHDYTKMNSLLMAKYNIEFPYTSLMNSASSFTNPGIEEVDYKNIQGVLTKTHRFIEESKKLEDFTLRVFKSSEVESFISEVVETFITLYQPEIISATQSKQEQYIPKKTLPSHNN